MFVKKVRTFLFLGLVLLLSVKAFGGTVIIDKKFLENLAKEKIKNLYKDEVRIDKINVYLYKPIIMKDPKIRTTLRVPPFSPAAYITIYLNSQSESKTLNAFAYIEWKVPVIVSKKLILRGEQIQKDYLENKVIYMRFVPQDLVVSKKELVGATANVNIGPDEPIRASMVSLRPIIHYGDKVRIIYDNNGIKIETYGIALGNGYLGKVLRVQNSQTKKIVVGKVIDDDTVFIGETR